MTNTDLIATARGFVAEYRRTLADPLPADPKSPFRSPSHEVDTIAKWCDKLERVRAGDERDARRCRSALRRAMTACRLP
jgi:hypothetical protein